MQQLTAGATHDYDTASRLITTRNTDTQNWTGASAKTSWYTYDDLGNRISHKHRTDSAIGYAHDKANRMTMIANKTQSYDKAGNVTVAYSADRGTSYTYRWDHHNRLTGVYDSTNTTRKAAFTWDALGRRVEFINDKLGTTTRYYYDGVNEIVEDNQSGTRQRYYVHGISYIDERLMMYRDANSRPYYYVVDRMYNVRMIVDRAGAIVERIAYDGYGQPYIRESAGRGDMNDDTQMTGTDSTRMGNAVSASIWDPRADLDDDGDVDSADQTLFDAKRPTWDPADIDFGNGPTVAQAFSDVDNVYMFQGVPHFALDTAAADTAGKLMLNEHRRRPSDVTTGRWLGRDPLDYNAPTLLPRGSFDLGQLHWLWRGQQQSEILRVVGHKKDSRVCLFEYLESRPTFWRDPSGLDPILTCACAAQPWQQMCTGICGRIFAPPSPPPPQSPPNPGQPCYYPNRLVCNPVFGCTIGGGWQSQCVCQCAGDSPGMNCMRGCIRCSHNNGAPINTDAEQNCEPGCNLTMNERNRLDCCINHDSNNGGCFGGGIFPPPPMNPNPGNTTCTSMPIP